MDFVTAQSQTALKLYSGARAMKRIAAVAMVFVVSGCTQPTVTGASRDEVIIRHDRVLDGVSDMQGMADMECGKYGKRAKFTKFDDETPLGMRYARFDCN
jgi:hypothetical protein